MLLFTVLYFTDASITDTETLTCLGSLCLLLGAFLGLSLGGTIGYFINRAPDLGPRILHTILPIKNKASNDWPYAWIPITGPDP